MLRLLLHIWLIALIGFAYGDVSPVIQSEHARPCAHHNSSKGCKQGNGLSANPQPRIFEGISDFFEGLFGGSDERCILPDVEEQLRYQVADCSTERLPSLRLQFGPADCELSSPIPSAPSCSKQCGAGEYLSWSRGGGNFACKQCPAGKFSVGGGERYQRWPQSLPPQFETTCYSLDPDHFADAQQVWLEKVNCDPWQVGRNGSMLSSGDNRRYNYVESYLILHLKFVRKGSLWFRFMVDAEDHADGLLFRIDHVNQPLDPSGSVFVSQILEPQRAEFAVEPGWHVFKWVYYKDMSVTYGKDRVELWEVGFNGTEWADTSCSSCPEGFSSVAGSSRCSSCEEGTVFDQTSQRCLSCNLTTHYALPGFSKCELRPPCRPDDYVERYTQCNSETNTRDKWYVWTEPKICRGQLLPPNVTGLPCPPCSVGKVLVQGKCSFCSPGYFADPASSQCLPCGPGSEAPLFQVMTDFSTWPEQMTTGCRGECGTAGWRSQGSFLEAGRDHYDATVWLRLDVVLVEVGSLQFGFSLACRGNDVSFVVEVDGKNLVDLCAGGGAAASSWSVSLSTGSHAIRWLYIQRSSLAGTDLHTARILNISLSGVAQGGALHCLPCPAGFFSTGLQTNCLACPEGFSSPPGATGCSLCEEGKFAPYPGSSTCFQCGANAVSGAGSAECSADCRVSWSEEEAVYDFAPLRTRLDGVTPMTYEDRDGEKQLVFLSLCAPLPLNSSCVQGMEALDHPRHSYSCSVNPEDTEDDSASQLERSGGAKDLGSTLSFLPLPKFLRARGFSKGLTIGLFNGDECEGGGGGGASKTWSTELHIVCNASKGVGVPTFLYELSSAEPCTMHVLWESQHGCPLCTDGDYKAMGGACVNGLQDISYFRKTECFAGVPMPPPEYGSSCIKQVAKVLPSWVLLLIVVAVVAVVGIIVYIACLYYRYRNMYEKYQKLVLSDRDVEHRDFDSEIIAEEG
ncbi:hypothetical protein GUITHDRAFT_165607 [Guillardia theta CCMP2712]|uniref:MRH domain-containing protein n=2 Tax=Guillardia theta TaxID=55529 RepID=L1IKX9_GUITC|nr:hypothetical protein GUITHDRAFT_165607 [Guillardia theta CCMP2712]EKX36891.1 hypothetical protein GUITHDRAFT_165607 [Guillardia theta CCMP2712]|mmetsp:Transcript_1067/g.3315  ORF Transcript_1067/g.3315 Transcript_1067/m.3315 type:complete len:965 (+) Transcript_1067:262-3156(+)|eukprot:XP_005823871.1 hypothetical protein GUITHDRAFT_165607 [Guillardia theta CCMP2712]